MPERGDWRRRHALQIASQLPENPEDAEVVLRHVHELVDNFLHKGVDVQEAAVLAFPDGGKSFRAS